MGATSAFPKLPAGAVPLNRSGELPPLLRLEIFDDLIRIDCPRCGRYLAYEVSVGFQPGFATCGRGHRLAHWRHPVTRQVIVRPIPHDVPWPEFHRLAVAELRAIAGKAGLL